MASPQYGGLNRSDSIGSIAVDLGVTPSDSHVVLCNVGRGRDLSSSSHGGKSASRSSYDLEDASNGVRGACFPIDAAGASSDSLGSLASRAFCASVSW